MKKGKVSEVAETGQRLIADERLRQVTSERYDADHDDDHEDGEMAQAANCYWELGQGSIGAYTQDADQSSAEMPEGWPWDQEWWNPKTRLRNLVRAGALYQAEIDRVTRRRDRVAEEIDELLSEKP